MSQHPASTNPKFMSLKCKLLGGFKFIHKKSLRTVLIIPLILQIVTAVGLVGYLSFKNGEKAVNKLAFQLQAEITDQVEDHMKDYLEYPHIITQTNINAF